VIGGIPGARKNPKKDEKMCVPGDPETECSLYVASAGNHAFLLLLAQLDHASMSLIYLESRIPDIMNRSRRLFSIATGFRVIDCLFPVAHGQRELLIGDRQTGKSTLALTATVNQFCLLLEASQRYF
jgi:F0F1-type ATP synthase beta subunit